MRYSKADARGAVHPVTPALHQVGVLLIGDLDYLLVDILIVLPHEAGRHSDAIWHPGHLEGDPWIEVGPTICLGNLLVETPLLQVGVFEGMPGIKDWRAWDTFPLH